MYTLMYATMYVHMYAAMYALMFFYAVFNNLIVIPRCFMYKLSLLPVLSIYIDTAELVALISCNPPWSVVGVRDL